MCITKHHIVHFLNIYFFVNCYQWNWKKKSTLIKKPCNDGSMGHEEELTIKRQTYTFTGNWIFAILRKKKLSKKRMVFVPNVLWPLAVGDGLSSLSTWWNFKSPGKHAVSVRVFPVDFNERGRSILSVDSAFQQAAGVQRGLRERKHAPAWRYSFFWMISLSLIILSPTDVRPQPLKLPVVDLMLVALQESSGSLLPDWIQLYGLAGYWIPCPPKHISIIELLVPSKPT